MDKIFTPDRVKALQDCGEIYDKYLKNDAKLKTEFDKNVHQIRLYLVIEKTMFGTRLESALWQLMCERKAKVVKENDSICFYAACYTVYLNPRDNEAEEKLITTLGDKSLEKSIQILTEWWEK